MDKQRRVGARVLSIRTAMLLFVLVASLVCAAACSSGGQPAGSGAGSSASSAGSGVDSTGSMSPGSAPPPGGPPGASSAGGSSGGGEGDAPETLAVIRWGTPTFKGDSGFLALGVEKGFFREQGIEIEWVHNDSDATLLKGLVSGDIDVGEFSPSGAMDAIAEGARLKVIGATIPGIPHVLFTRSDIRSAKDLEGRTVNILSPGAFYDVLMTLYMRDHGADASKMNKVAVGASAAGFQALVAGKVDASAASVEFAKQIEGDPNFHVLVKFSEALPNFLRFTLIASEDMLKNKPDLLQRFAYARSKTLRYAVSNRDEVLAFGTQLLGLPPDDEGIALAVDTVIDERLTQPDLVITPERMQYMLDARMLMDPAKKPLTIEQVLDTRFQEKVVETMGAWEWK